MKVFLFILDGCAVAQFKEAKTPFLDKIAEEGMSTFKCQAVFPTATYTGHSTIITGNYPDKHGMVGNQFWDRQSNCNRNFDSFNPNHNIESPTIFELLPFPTCSICEPVTRGASLVIEKQLIDKIPLEAQNLSISNHLKEALTENIQFYMVNFQGVDGFGEATGPLSSSYLGCLSEVDKFIAEITTKIKSEFVFVVTADHGMTSVNSNVDLERELKMDGFNVKCLASHRCCHIYCDSHVEALENHLRLQIYIDKIYNTTELEKIHLNHWRTGDLVVSAKKGFEFGKKKLRGSHGGATLDEILVPFIIYGSQGRLIEKLDNISMSLVDICPTVLDIFGIEVNSKFQGKSLFNMQ